MAITNYDLWTRQYTEWDQVPRESRENVMPAIAGKLGEPVDHLFPAFASDFPQTVDAMRRHWSMPKLVSTESLNPMLVLENERANLFFDILTNSHSATDGPAFQTRLAMLPPTWLELYRLFNSFFITERVIGGSFWTNTPFSVLCRIPAASFFRSEEWHSYMETRRLAEMYVKFTDFNADEFDAFVASVTDKPDWLNCWCVNDALDTLWIDEDKNDGRVHCVRRGDFTHSEVLQDPGHAMDCYLAHLVAGKSVHDFDFAGR